MHQIRWLRGIFPHRNERILPHHHPLMYPWPLGPTDVYYMFLLPSIVRQFWIIFERKCQKNLIHPLGLALRNIFIQLMLVRFYFCFKWTYLAQKCIVWNWNSSLSWSGDPTKLEGQRDYHSHCQDPRTIFIVIRSQGNRKWEIVQSDCTWSKSQDDQENSISHRWSSVAVCLMFIVWRSLNPVSKMAFKTKH